MTQKLRSCQTKKISNLNNIIDRPSNIFHSRYDTHDVTQEQIKETNLTSEDIDVAHPRRNDAPDDNTEQCKRFRSAIDKSINEFICPITQELPIDPVIAEDGNVYERVAIEQ